DIIATHFIDNDNAVVLAGERIRIQILNSDGTEKALIIDSAVPGGKQVNLSVGWSGTVTDVV
ncbi:MAG TPA: hypothetical protein VFI02_19795, partial [Armatimonadota bacterium]|nr:hypothetical protein [Armatimonadota bacterium]